MCSLTVRTCVASLHILRHPRPLLWGLCRVSAQHLHTDEVPHDADAGPRVRLGENGEACPPGQQLVDRRGQLLEFEHRLTLHVQRAVSNMRPGPWDGRENGAVLTSAVQEVVDCIVCNENKYFRCY